jgi:hypothetical protein
MATRKHAFLVMVLALYLNRQFLLHVWANGYPLTVVNLAQVRRGMKFIQGLEQASARSLTVRSVLALTAASRQKSIASANGAIAQPSVFGPFK